MKQHLLTILLLSGITAAQAVTTVNVTAGSLDALLTDVAADETALVLTGTLDITDLRSIAALPQRLPAVRSVDMTDAVIVSSRLSEGDYLGYTYLPALELPPYIFANVPFTTIALPATLSAIGEGALAGAAITSAAIPAGVAKIGDFAFYGCPALREVKAGNKLTAVGKGTFANCTALVSADFGATAITELPERVFAGCSALESLPLPSSLLTVGPEAFAGTAITSLSLSAVRQLAPFSLSNMPATEAVTLSSSAEQGEGALAGSTALTRLQGAPADLPDAYAAGCASLNPYDFLRESVSIGESAIAGTKADMLLLSGSLLSVGRGAFEGISGLTAIDASALGARIPSTPDGAFDNVPQDEIYLIVAPGEKETWSSHPQWGAFRVIDSTETGASAPVDADRIRISASGRAITVSAPDPIRQIMLVTTDGRVLCNVAPQLTECTLVAPQEEIVIIRAVTDRGIRTARLLLR